MRYITCMKNPLSYSFRAIIESDKPSGYHGFVPILKGLHTFGKTIEKTRRNIREAIICHIQGLMKDGLAVPREGESLETIQHFSERELIPA